MQKYVLALIYTKESLKNLFQAQNNVVKLYLKLNTFLMNYNHDLINKWIVTNFLRNRYGKKFEDNLVPTNNKPNQNNFLQTLLSKYVINGCAEFCHVSALIKLKEQYSWMGFTHLKILLEQAEEKRGCKSSISNII